MKTSLTTFLLLGFGLVSLNAQVVADDFDDGNDAGWTRSSPLEGVGGTMAYSFPGGNSYRMVAGVSPNGAVLGGGRGGAFLPEVYTSIFHVEVDLVSWDNSLEQDVGILAFLTNPGLGTTGGYAFSYDVDDQEMFISRLDGEVASSLGSFGVTLDPAKNYRLVFEGFEGQMRGDVFDLADPEFPLGSTSGFDQTYNTGPCGLFVADGSSGGTGTADATFDNYRTSTDTDVDLDFMSDQWELAHFGDILWWDDEDFDGDKQTNLEEFIGGSDPANAASLSGLVEVEVAGGTMTVSFTAVDGRSYLLETSPDLENWTAQPGAVFSRDNGTGSLVQPAAGADELYARVRATVE